MMLSARDFQDASDQAYDGMYLESLWSVQELRKQNKDEEIDDYLRIIENKLNKHKETSGFNTNDADVMADLYSIQDEIRDWFDLLIEHTNKVYKESNLRKKAMDPRQAWKDAVEAAKTIAEIFDSKHKDYAELMEEVAIEADGLAQTIMDLNEWLDSGGFQDFVVKDLGYKASGYDETEVDPEEVEYAASEEEDYKKMQKSKEKALKKKKSYIRRSIKYFD